ncbi:hypothetical protein ACFSQD_09260 [Flavihumibacter stibioxidans]|uniref:Uncharacterized protein n=1 Tax=Flavihumibacter stibioxidans TaxID=1834163 RepID=A0ABR7M647_9BACT|nr:hypothetical protein [Flavihumibacter stibioxidans]MBC6490501.1 hypothetical protein [Flavihumibacter stibioxidans]
MARSVIVTITATVYLLVYIVLHALDIRFGWILFLFSFSPAIMVWLVLSILSDHSVHMRELEDEEEWGYADRPGREGLGVF